MAHRRVRRKGIGILKVAVQSGRALKRKRCFSFEEKNGKNENTFLTRKKKGSGALASKKKKKAESMGAAGGVEVFCFFVAVSLNVLCYLFHALPKKWKACGCPKKLLYVSNR